MNLVVDVWGEDDREGQELLVGLARVFLVEGRQACKSVCQALIQEFVRSYEGVKFSYDPVIRNPGVRALRVFSW
jgi:hypothetical protein